MLQLIIGGLIGILGVLLGMWFQLKYARRIRMEEILAEKKVIANGDAYTRMKTIESMLLQSTLKEVNTVIKKQEDWFFNNRLFLPGKFPDKWLSIRNGVSKALRLEKCLQRSKESEIEQLTYELAELDKFLRSKAKEAIDEIYKEMRLPRLEIEPLPKKEKK